MEDRGSLFLSFSRVRLNYLTLVKTAEIPIWCTRTIDIRSTVQSLYNEPHYKTDLDIIWPS